MVSSATQTDISGGFGDDNWPRPAHLRTRSMVHVPVGFHIASFEFIFAPICPHLIALLLQLVRRMRQKLARAPPCTGLFM